MKAKMLRCAAFIAFAIGTVQASEYRAPVTAQSGPLRYDVYKKKDKWTLNLWSIGHYRSAEKAFLKHGTDTHNFSALLFGKENFKLSEAFAPGVATTEYTENYNLNVGSKLLTPRASYSERGMTLGGRFEYPVWQNKGRVGVRAAIPFKTVRVERDDDAETASQGDQTTVIRGDLSVDLRMPQHNAAPQNVGANNAVIGNERRDVSTNLYRVDFVKDLPFIRGGNIEHFVATSAVNPTQVGGAPEYNVDIAAVRTNASRAFEHAYTTQIPFVVIKNSNSKALPLVSVRAVKLPNPLQQWIHAVATDVVVGNAHNAADVIQNKVAVLLPEDVRAGGRGIPLANIFQTGQGAPLGIAGAREREAFEELRVLNTDFNALAENTAYVPNGNTDYSALFRDHGDKLWLMAVNTDDGVSFNHPGTIADLDGKIARWGSQSTEQWMHRNGFDLMSTQRTGLGDVDVDAFYEHDFNADWRGEVVLGLRLPTGGSSDYSGNPYKANPLLGNGNHFEVKLGANVGWATPFDWLNLKADASYSFVLKGKEQRIAAFKGATISGIGPKADADVDWGYFVGQLDATLFHRKTDDLSTTIGYELYYKTKDNVNFKQSKLTNVWFGKHWVNGQGFVDFDHELDNKGAERNTDRIAHRIRFESHWHAHKYMSLFAGGAFTFAGKNMAKEGDMHCGMNVRFQ